MACDLTAIEIIKIRAPQYYLEPNEKLIGVVDLARCKTGKEFGKCFEEAVALRALHWIVKSGASNASEIGNTNGLSSVGVVTSVKEGDDAISYGGSAISGKGSSKYGDLSTTTWGQELIELMNSCLLLPRTRLV